MLVPPSKRIAIRASVATRWTSWNVSRPASRSESSEATAATISSKRRRRQPDPGGEDADEDRDRQRPGDDEDDAPEIEDVVHAADSPCCGGARGSRCALTDSLRASHCRHIPATDTDARMRLAALILLALVLSAGVASGAAVAPGGSFEVKGGRGIVQITGKGVLVGRLGKGSLEIVDLTPERPVEPPRQRHPPRQDRDAARQEHLVLRCPAGRYKIIARGSDISISARGTGAVDPGRRSRRGRRHRACTRSATGDLVPLPEDGDEGNVRAGVTVSTPSPQSVKIQP